MSTEPAILPDGEIFMVSDRLMHLERTELVAVAGFVLGREGSQLQVHATLAGRINNSTEQTDITIAMSPRDAFAFAGMLLDQIEALAAAPSDPA